MDIQEKSLGKVERCDSSHDGELCLLPKGHYGPHVKHYFWTNCDPSSLDDSKKILQVLQAQEELQKLSTKELVAKCVKTRSADSLVVLEMMRRLDPNWADL